jgi:hypothetical protein
MGKPSRDKGLRRERGIVELHVKCGIHAERVPLSGASHYQGNGADIDVYGRGRGAPPFRAEVKARGDGSGFRTLARWLGQHDVLFLWQDRQAPLVVMPVHVWLELLALAGGGTPPAPANDADADRPRRQRRAAIEHGPQPPTDAIGEHIA